jgi:hypothetical protein
MTPKQFYHFLACIAKSVARFALSLAQVLRQTVNFGTRGAVNAGMLVGLS